MDLAEAIGGDENFYSGVQLDDKKNFRENVTKGN